MAKDLKTGQQYISTAQGEARALYEARKEERAQCLVHRRALRAKRSPQQQLKLLDNRLGEGKGAKKERAKLWGLIADKLYEADLEKAKRLIDEQEQS